MGGEEVSFVDEAFDSNYIAPVGPMVDAFVQEFAERVGMGNAVGVSIGTSATLKVAFSLFTAFRPRPFSVTMSLLVCFMGLHLRMLLITWALQRIPDSCGPG